MPLTLSECLLFAMQSVRKDGPELIDDFVNTAYEYYKVQSTTQLLSVSSARLEHHLPEPELRIQTQIAVRQNLLLTQVLCHSVRPRCRRRASGCASCIRLRTTRAVTMARRASCTSGAHGGIVFFAQPVTGPVAYDAAG